MHPGSAVHLRITLGKLQCMLCAEHIVSYIYYGLDPMLCEALKQCFSVFVKCLIVIVGMCIKNHLFPPAFFSVFVFMHHYSQSSVKNNDYRGFLPFTEMKSKFHSPFVWWSLLLHS